jgi:Holliday junction resolvase RusA-like endonuclease
MKVVLPLPPTLNSSFRARKDGRGQYKTGEAKAWEHEAHYLLNKVQPIRGAVRLIVNVYYKYDRDIDASLKLLLDALEGKVYINDSQVTMLTVTKQKDNSNPHVEVSWHEIAPGENQ